MADVARYLERPNAKLYALVCERYGVDPADVIDDEFLAVQLRVGAVVIDTSEPETAAGEDMGAPFDAAREGARKLREAM